MSDEKKKQGFATMDRDDVAELGRKGGQAAHASGTAYVFDSAAAKKASRIAVAKRRQKAKERREAGK